MDDIRYSEFVFLRALAVRRFEFFDPADSKQTEPLSLPVGAVGMYSEMAATLIEDLYVRFDEGNAQLLVSRLRGELASHHGAPSGIQSYQWSDPRTAILQFLQNTQPPRRLRITYRGMRRIEELRDLLRRDRILEDFGVLLSIRYFRRDFEDALQRSPDVSVSVLYADMDDFGKINKKYGQAAGDVVMKKYLEVVRDCLGSLGTGYRGVGDETCALILGQGNDRAVEIAEVIRKGVETMRCEYEGIALPKVTTSIGVATTPPEGRTLDVENSAEDRKRQAKEKGKNRVISINQPAKRGT
jgi:diguanylate cyclase (GGDEF)-like protein